jgi:hypothetical protein
VNTVSQWHIDNHEDILYGRFISAKKTESLILGLETPFKVKTVGYSIENRCIYSVEVGEGPHKILMWSQMHGNESTTTKAVFDVIKAISDPNAPDIFKQILQECSICIIPQLNPDGATAYTRVNAANVDLNRDAQLLSQPESKVLRKIFDAFEPDVCFNLHGQRTIYGLPATGSPSVLSFLAPAADVDRGITLSRKRAMSLISHINKEFASDLNGRIGRYDDGFNVNCTGDAFMSEGVPTVLFEAGHYTGDYEREVVRHMVFRALIAGITGVIEGVSYETSDYFLIPEHQKCYCDVLIKKSAQGDVAIQFEEVLNNEAINFVPKVVGIGDKKLLFGHRIIDVKGQGISHLDGSLLLLDDTVLAVKVDDGTTITLS